MLLEALAGLHRPAALDQLGDLEVLGALPESLGFESRIRGSHHIYWRTGVAEILNLQDKGGKAKPYQVKQVRTILVRYKLVAEP